MHYLGSKHKKHLRGSTPLGHRTDWGPLGLGQYCQGAYCGPHTACLRGVSYIDNLSPTMGESLVVLSSEWLLLFLSQVIFTKLHMTGIDQGCLKGKLQIDITLRSETLCIDTYTQRQPLLLGGGGRIPPFPMIYP